MNVLEIYKEQTKPRSPGPEPFKEMSNCNSIRNRSQAKSRNDYDAESSFMQKR